MRNGILTNKVTETPCGLTLSRCRIAFITWTLLCMMPITGMAVDLFAPSLPSIAADLHLPAQWVKNLIAIYLVGYGFGNFISGFLTDSWGRQKILRGGLVAFIVVTLLPIFFPSIHVLLFTRLCQGLTLGAFAVVSRAIFSDVLCAERLVRLGTFMATMWGLGPVIGPIIGGYLQEYFGWKSCFVFFSGLVLIALLLICGLIPETSKIRHPFNYSTMKKNTLDALLNPLFMGLVIAMGFMYAILISFHTAAPFLIQDILGYSPVFFGHIALYLGLLFLSATFLCRYFLKKMEISRLILRAMIFFLGIAILNGILSIYLPLNIYFITLSSGLMFFACGFIFPLLLGQALALSKHMSAAATATMFLINIVITGIISFIISFFNATNVILLSMVDLVLLLGALTLYWKFIYIRKESE
jgi:Bcr/CflA subfamily drug resistance transporter